MKKNKFVFGFLFCSVLLSLIGCASTSGTSSVIFDTNIDYESDNPLVTLSVESAWNSFFGGGFTGFYCTFKNNSDESVRIVWDESSVNYNGNTYVPFIDGQKYIKAQEPMSPAVIAKGGTVSKGVYSSDQPHYTSGKYGGWTMNKIYASEVQLLFLVRGKSSEEYITATIKAVSNKSSSTETSSESNK